LRDSLESTPPAMSEKEMRVCGYDTKWCNVRNNVEISLYYIVVVLYIIVCVSYILHTFL
jgi:hypothetical protein